jgi:hypothetical protein
MKKETLGAVIEATQMKITSLFHFFVSIETLMDSDIIACVILTLYNRWRRENWTHI